MAVRLRVNGQVRSLLSESGTCGQLSYALNRRRTFDFRLLVDGTPSGGSEVWRSGRGHVTISTPDLPQCGWGVVLDDPTIPFTYFSGTIDSYDQENWAGSPQVAYSVRCVDNNALADRFTITGSWTGVNAGNIVADIVDNALGREGVTHNSVASGPVLTGTVSFFNIQASDALNQIAQLAGNGTTDGSGFAWFIDDLKDMHFFSAADGIATAPFQISDSSINWQSLTLTPDRSKYANRVIVHSGQILGSDTQTDTLHGDGTMVNFDASAPLGSVPTITVNGTAKTVGVDGVASGMQWYYNLGSTRLVQATAETVLGTGDALVVSYIPITTDNYTVVEDTTEQAARAVIEGGTGIYEIGIDNNVLGTVADATAVGQAYLRQNGRIRRYLSFVIDRPPQPWSTAVGDNNPAPPEPGQLLTVSHLPLYLITTPTLFMFESCSAQLMSGGKDGVVYFRWTVKAVNGEYQQGWEKVLFRDNAVTGGSSAIASTDGALVIAYA